MDSINIYYATHKKGEREQRSPFLWREMGAMKNHLPFLRSKNRYTEAKTKAQKASTGDIPFAAVGFRIPHAAPK